MRSDLGSSVWVLAALILVILLALPPSLRAQQQHVVSPADIRKELVNVTQTRRQNREKVRDLFSSKVAQDALKKAGVDPGQVQAGISTLSDAELARLAARAETAQADFAAGRISDRDLIIILVVIAVIILIIVAVD
ncbi:MAG TPA: PA2779 family protein [Pyrinomonadaceae bacterium]